MKTIGLKEGQRKAISPVIATVILIAITLIAAIAIGGFVFGIFGSSSSTAQVSQGGYVMPAGKTITVGTAAPLAVACGGTAGSDYVTLTNAGSGSTSVTAVSFTIGGVTATATGTSLTGTCNIGGSGSTTATLTLSISEVLATGTLSAGTTFTGVVTLANGGQVPITGTLQ